MVKNRRQLCESSAYALPVSVDARPTLASREMVVQEVENKIFAEI